MANWVRRLRATRERPVGKTKLDELIAQGRVRAKKEGTAKNAAVLVDLDSYDAYVEALPDAQGSLNPKKKATRRNTAEATT
jgi:hypothetical protein